MFKWLKKLLKRNPPDLIELATKNRERKFSEDDIAIIKRREDEFRAARKGGIAFDVEEEETIQITDD